WSATCLTCPACARSWCWAGRARSWSRFRRARWSRSAGGSTAAGASTGWSRRTPRAEPREGAKAGGQRPVARRTRIGPAAPAAEHPPGHVRASADPTGGVCCRWPPPARAGGMRMQRQVVSFVGLVLTFITLASTGAAQPPGPRRAQRGGDVKGVLVRVGAPALVRAGETERTVVVVGADAVVDGDVLENLVVVGGDARVSGDVAGDVVMVGGQLALEPGARVGGNVLLHGNSTIARAPGAVVDGAVQRSAGVAF